MKYAGIGSRATPLEILRIMRQIAAELEKAGYTCRTGGALGADKAFIDGAPSTTELWLPWDGYNGYSSDNPEPTEREERFASKYHPNWKACKSGARKMHARNCNIALGANLDDPVDFIVCWTPNGEMTGGTAQALRVAIDYDIPIYNLGAKAGPASVLKRLRDYIQSQK
ncbi:DprA-like DNA recombination-mediator protein [Acinetobacter phage Acj9]|uniref:DNA recombination-mediator protein A n=1 Tax=Acinetobacter phage Acj9 TaxID=760939 RepID=E5EPH8_9CAUD|nr:DprA-like DNA recombination-mediator protein [Acinetobacter phage Acj9]ADG59944.1 conserved hypothetical protein [Acinetobacter phage Acj9]